VEKRLDDFKQASEDMIGKGKFRGCIRDNIDEDFVYGIKSIKNDDLWNVGKCIHGDNLLAKSLNLEPDIDLGRSVIFKSKLQAIQPKEYDPNRIFGVPSVRYDLSKKRNASVCDMIVITFNKNFYLLYFTKLIQINLRIMEMKKMHLNCCILTPIPIGGLTTTISRK